MVAERPEASSLAVGALQLANLLKVGVLPIECVAAADVAAQLIVRGLADVAVLAPGDLRAGRL